MAINCVSSPSEIEAKNQITNKTQAQAQQMLNLNIYVYAIHALCSVGCATENGIGIQFLCGRYWRNYVISFHNLHDSFLLISHQNRLVFRSNFFECLLLLLLLWLSCVAVSLTFAILIQSIQLTL